MKPGIKLRVMREALCWTQRHLGQLAKLSPTQVSNLETGQRNIGPNIRPRLAKAFNMTEEEFTRALHSDERTAAFWAKLHQIHVDDRDKLLQKLGKALENIQENPALFDHLLSSLDIFFRPCRKIKLISPPHKKLEKYQIGIFFALHVNQIGIQSEA